MFVTLCGISMQSPAAQTPGAEVCIRSSTMSPLAEPTRSPAALARSVFASFLVQTTARSQGISPAEVATARTVPSPTKPSSVVLKCSLRALLDPGVLHRPGDVGIGGSGQRPGVGVDEVGFDAAMAQGGHHLQAQRRRLHHHRGPGFVEHFVPVHGLADVLDVVKAAKIGAGHSGGRVIEPRAHDEFVVGNVALAFDGHRLGAGVETRHPCLIVDVYALVRVSFLCRQEKPLEVGNLLAVDIGNTARAVPDVLELGVDDDVRSGVGALGGPGRADARGAATDHHDPLGHPCTLFPRPGNRRLVSAMIRTL